MQWKTTVATTCSRVTARRKKRKLQRRRKRRNPQRRNLLSRWEPEPPHCNKPAFDELKDFSLSVRSEHQELGLCVHHQSRRVSGVFRISVGVQCLDDQLEGGSEGPEEGDEENTERGEEENKERTAEAAGWDGDEEFMRSYVDHPITNLSSSYNWEIRVYTGFSWSHSECQKQCHSVFMIYVYLA